jgi:CRISPR-associated protein Cmr4
MSNSRILYLFTRTPLHVGAGASVGAIDQPIQRERHTGFPIIPGSSLKGTFADLWNGDLRAAPTKTNGNRKVRVTDDGSSSPAAWLFGSDNDKHASAGALQFSEARLLAFPIRSAKGSFAWITCPLILQRAVRDGVLSTETIRNLPELPDDRAVFDANGPLSLGTRIVLEEYTFEVANPWLGLATLETALKSLLSSDPIWSQLPGRLVILSNGMMSFFTRNACEIAQHVRINDETGTAEKGGLFNQENVPSETLFYGVLNAMLERRSGSNTTPRTGEEALTTFADKVKDRVLQFGADASTGMGYCSVWIPDRI